jgi:ribosomal-protein-alanine N-acetyltransferase
MDAHGDKMLLTLETDRLTLRPYNQMDAEAIYQVVGRREIAETTVNIPHPYPRGTVDWWINFINENIKNDRAYEFGIFLKQRPHAYIGNCGLPNLSKQHNHAEIAYFISPDYWNQGYAAEAAARIVEFGFKELQLERIHGRCMTKNIGSRRVMEKAGLKYEGLARHEILKWDIYEDVWNFGLIREEWQQARK